MAASVRARLATLARTRGQSFDLLLTRYCLERLLYRLSLTPHQDSFILKGAMLMACWYDVPHRPTRDLDLMGMGDPTHARLLQIFTEVCAISLEDGVVFDTASLAVGEIRAQQIYGGLRVRTRATIERAQIPVSIDIGFGDATEPGLETLALPVLLDMPAPTLKTYARETVIAEKFHALVVLGLANSRLKDFYDMWFLASTYDFDGNRLARAIQATFQRRQTPLPVEIPDALTDHYASDPARQRQWEAFVADLAERPLSFTDMIGALAIFLMPHVEMARQMERV